MQQDDAAQAGLDLEIEAPQEADGDRLIEVENLPSTKRQRHQSFLDPAKRNLREEELESPAARRFMIAEIDRLTDECDDLKGEIKSLRKNGYDNAILTEKIENIQKKKGYETVVFGLSSIGVGASPSYLSSDPNTWIFLVIFSAGLISSGLRVRS